MTRVGWLLFLIGISINVQGQTLNSNDSLANPFSDDPNFKHNYFHYGMGCYLIMPSVNISGPIQLNNIFKNQGAPTLNQSTLMAGLGLDIRNNRVSAGFEFISGSNEQLNERYRLNADLYMVNMTAKFYVHPKLTFGSFYPFIGFNGHVRSVYLTDISNTNNINVLFQNSGSVNLKYTSYFLNGGIGYDFFNLQKEVSYYGSIKLGIRTNIAPTEDNLWFVNEEVPLQGSPIEKLNSVFIQVGVGVIINHREYISVL
ncbi:MAG: hypothetical protein MUE96_07785 [Bacteroidia bacterium]|jgi:hypothetical protein|nr:hypothetical protein [Bacteroidia bacterium]